MFVSLEKCIVIFFNAFDSLEKCIGIFYNVFASLDKCIGIFFNVCFIGKIYCDFFLMCFIHWKNVLEFF